VSIVAKGTQIKNPQYPPHNVLELLKKELDVKIEQRAEADVVIITNNK